MSDQTPIRIAMWSGPRNISTAMMRSFENRPDCAVIDEPFYASYLKLTGLEHPMHKEIIAAGLLDPADVARKLVGPVPGNRQIFYQKHMLQHMIEPIPHDWLRNVEHAFLIRDPAKMVASYARKRADVTAEDLGYYQLDRLYDEVCQLTGMAPPIIDAEDILGSPQIMIEALCSSLGISFMPQMLNWPAGERDSDGIWGVHWYSAVWRSTGFIKAPSETTALNDHQRCVADACMPHYEKFKSLALSAHTQPKK